MLKSFVGFFIVSAIVCSIFSSPLPAQVKPKAAVPQPRPVPAPPTAKGPTLVPIDAPPAALIATPKLPTAALQASTAELHFGSQGTGVESCLQIMITNTTTAAQTITHLFVEDQKRYSIPSPSSQMLPISIQPKTTLTISVCFKPEKTGEYKTRIVIKSPTDSIIIPTIGKGIRPEDVGKLPKSDFTVIKKKKNNWDLKLQLIAQCKITMQLFDELGSSKVTFWNGAFKNEGVYETPFDGTDKDKKKLPPGKYYVRCQIDDSIRKTTVKFTKEIEIK